MSDAIKVTINEICEGEGVVFAEIEFTKEEFALIENARKVAGLSFEDFVNKAVEAGLKRLELDEKRLTESEENGG